MTVYGFVQAGGGSTRFGRDKALVELRGKTMLERTTELVAKVCEDVHVIAPSGRYEVYGWPILTDLWPGQGPLSGILSALHRLNDGADAIPGRLALIVGCDMPFLTPEFLIFLCKYAYQSKALVLVPQSANGLEPLCACWRPAGAPALQSAFDDGIRKVTDAMKRLPMEVLDENVWKRFDTKGHLFSNMNTPADFDEARRILERSD